MRCVLGLLDWVRALWKTLGMGVVVAVAVEGAGRWGKDGGYTWYDQRCSRLDITRTLGVECRGLQRYRMWAYHRVREKETADDDRPETALVLVDKQNHNKFIPSLPDFPHTCSKSFRISPNIFFLSHIPGMHPLLWGWTLPKSPR